MKGWSVVLLGVMVAEGAFLDAGAIGTKDVKLWTIVAGNQAKKIGESDEIWMDRDG